MLTPGFETPIMRDILDDLGITIGGDTATGTKVLPEIYIDDVNGQRYQIDTNGRRVYLPAAPRDSAPRITVNPADTTGAWSIQYDSNGNGFKVNKITGDVIPLDFDKTPGAAVNPADKNGDGIDDTSNYAVGVFPDKNSSTGYAVYNGAEAIPVRPNGADARPQGATYGGSGGGAPDTISSGGRTYIWDAKANSFVLAPGILPSGSSGTNSVNVSSGSGLTAAEQLAIANARAKGDVLSARAKADADIQVQREQAQLQKDLLAEKARLDQEGDLLAQAWQKDPTNPANIERERNYALRIQEFNASLRERQQDRKLRAAEGMPAALRAYDAKAYFDALESAGFDVNNLLASGTNLLTQNALLPAATLQAILNEPDAVASTGLPVPGSTAGGAPSTPPPPGGAPPTPPPSGPSQALQDAERAHTAALSGLRNATWQANQPQKGSDRMIDLGRAQEGQWANSLLTGIQPLSFDVLGQARGGTQSIDFTLPNYVDPSAPKAIDYGNDHIQREQGPAISNEVTTGSFKPGEAVPDLAAGYRYDPATNSWKGSAEVVRPPVPGLNSGGPVNAGMAVVGEGGGRKPLGSSELLIDPTQDAQVVPITGRQAQQYLSSGIPGYNDGTDSYSGFDAGASLAVSRPRRTSTATVRPVATVGLPTQPVSQPATQPTQPAPVAQPTQPTQPVANTGLPAPQQQQPVQPGVQPQTTQPTAAAGLPPPNQAVLDEIQRKRTETVLMGGPDPNDIQWQIRSPLYQQTWAQNRAQATGIPEEEFLWQGAMNRRGVGGVAQSGLRPMRY